MKFALLPLFLLTALTIIGCSHSGNPIEPSSPSGFAHDQTEAPNSNVLLLGFWDITISADHQSIDATPLRSVEMHLNAIRLLEVSPCTNCLTISDIAELTPTHLQAKLTLRHPFPGLNKYTAFDVHGIFISGGDFTFPQSGRLMAKGNALPRLLNADGFSTLFNPTEFPETLPGLAAFKYFPGKYAPGGDLSTTLNPYVAYNQDKPRCMFTAGSSSSRTVQLYVPSGPIHFGYAAQGCWQPVDKPVIDPIKDFPPSANCTEAYKISVQIGKGLDVSTGASAEISVEVFDHQGLDTISSVAVESPDLFAGALPLSYKNAAGLDSWLFSGTIKNDKSAGGSSYPVLVRAVDTDLDPNLGQVDAWQVVDVALEAPIGNGWALTWGGVSADRSYDATVDSSGNIYVTGFFSADVDLDPGSGEDIRSALGELDIYLSKFTPFGQRLWTVTWGGPETDWSAAIVADSADSIYVAGYFAGDVDFDPGPGVDYRQSQGLQGFFLNKFDSAGNYQWARTMPGGIDVPWPCGAAVDGSDHISVSGRFEDTGDFDPGPDTDLHTSNGLGDSFISNFDSLGNWQWTRTWGGVADEAGLGVAADTAGNVYETGWFQDTVDFDPGPDSDIHTAAGPQDIYLIKLDSSGAFQWAHTWGGVTSGPDYEDYGGGIAANDSLVWVSGLFTGAADFDPGPGTDTHTPVGAEDIFLTKFDSQGIFQWARTWGSVDYDGCWGVDIDGAGDVYVNGWFSGPADFDPGAGIDDHAPNGSFDCCLSKFDPQGNSLWARTWGGLSADFGLGVHVDPSGNAFSTGIFTDTADFNPGPGTDIHQCNGSEDAFLSKFPSDGNW